MTIQARAADYLISQGERIFTSEERDMTPAPIRKHLAVKDTFAKGVPPVFK